MNNSSHITVLIDRSGSMDTIRRDAQGAVNNFIREQQKVDEPCSLLLVDFDAPGAAALVHDKTGGLWYRTVYDGPVQDAPVYALEPRGSTALYDAMVRAIDETGARLRDLPEGERPSHVFFVIQTDGGENASRTYRQIDQVIDKIKHQESKYSWQFIFLGAGSEAWNQGQMFVGTAMMDNMVIATGTGASYAGAVTYTGSNIAQARQGKGVSYNGKIDDQGNVSQ